MLTHDIRESRVYQEALQEGRQEGRQEVLALAIAGMANNRIPVEKIAEALKMDVEHVRMVMAESVQG